jgi:hypothetical protein
MLELIKSQRFQTEYQTYQSKIEKISDENIKNQATVLLKTLVVEIKKLDSQHQDMFSGNQIPMGLGDVRNNITSIRKKIDRLCKDCEK